MKKEPLVVGLIMNYNGASIPYKNKSILETCLRSLKNSTYRNLKLVVADDNSKDNSRKIVKEIGGIDFIVREKIGPGNYTKNANNGIRYAIKKYNPDYIALFNDDIINKDRDWFRKMVEVGESDEKIGIIGCKYLYGNGRLQHAGITSVGAITRLRGWDLADASKYTIIDEVAAVGGAACLVKREVIDKIGLLDENFYLGSDDTDYCLRAGRAGFRIMYNGKASLIHLAFQTTTSVAEKNKKEKDYLFPILQINYVYSAFKNLNAIQKVEVIFVALAAAFVGIGDGQVKLTSLKLRDDVLWRFKVSVKAIFIAYALYRGKIDGTEAYRQFR